MNYILTTYTWCGAWDLTNLLAMVIQMLGTSSECCIAIVVKLAIMLAHHTKNAYNNLFFRLSTLDWPASLDGAAVNN